MVCIRGERGIREQGVIRGGEGRQAKGTFSPVPLAVVGVGTGAAASVVLLPLAVPWREREEEEEASLPMSA